MGHSHSPGAVGDADPVSRVGRVVALWPGQGHVQIPAQFNPTGETHRSVAGKVTDRYDGSCGGPKDLVGQALAAPPTRPATPAEGTNPSTTASSAGAQVFTCPQAIVAIGSGPERGRYTILGFDQGPGSPDLRTGESIRVARSIDGNGRVTYYFADYTMRTSAALLGALAALGLTSRSPQPGAD